MLRSIKEIQGYKAQAQDGELGAARDFLFDDEYWTVRWLTLDTNKWFPASRKVLLSPVSLKQPDFQNKRIAVALSKDKIEKSPSLDSHLPVSRQYEAALFRYFGYGAYWTGPDRWGLHTTPEQLINEKIVEDISDQSGEQELHLRSCNEIIGYSVVAKDETVGRLSDFILEDNKWAIEYLAVNTRQWWPGGKEVLVSVDKIKKISWKHHIVELDLSAQQIKKCPEVIKEDAAGRINTSSIH